VGETLDRLGASICASLATLPADAVTSLFSFGASQLTILAEVAEEDARLRPPPVVVVIESPVRVIRVHLW
jgi:hypothetical protein